MKLMPILSNSLTIVLLSLLVFSCGRQNEGLRQEVELNRDTDVLQIFEEMSSHRLVSENDQRYRRIVELGHEAVPDLIRIAEDKEIRWHFVAFSMLGEIGDSRALPALFKGIESEGRWVRWHSVSVLNSFLNLGTYEDGDERKEREVISRYQEWHEQEVLMRYGEWSERRDTFARKE